MTKHLTIKIHGRVQGVFFRKSAYEEANKLGIKGSVRNAPDGTVWIEAEAAEDKLDRFLEWCKDGPQHAEVDKIETTEKELKYFREFEIVK
jgi:acylphosphatase